MGHKHAIKYEYRRPHNCNLCHSHCCRGCHKCNDKSMHCIHCGERLYERDNIKHSEVNAERLFPDSKEYRKRKLYDYLYDAYWGCTKERTTNLYHAKEFEEWGINVSSLCEKSNHISDIEYKIHQKLNNMNMN